MTNFTDTISATPAVTFLRSRFAPWQMFCGTAEDASEAEAEAPQAGEDETDDYDAEDPRDIFVRDRLARLEAFSAA